MGAAREIWVLKWILLPYSFEVFIGLRGQVPGSVSIISLLFRGLLPPVVNIVGDSYSAAVLLFVVSALPYYRGSIRTCWVMDRRQMVGDVVVQFFMSLLAIYFIVLVDGRLNDDLRVSSNPISVLVGWRPFDGFTYSLLDEDGWKMAFHIFDLLHGVYGHDQEGLTCACIKASSVTNTRVHSFPGACGRRYPLACSS